MTILLGVLLFIAGGLVVLVLCNAYLTSYKRAVMVTVAKSVFVAAKWYGLSTTLQGRGWPEDTVTVENVLGFCPEATSAKPPIAKQNFRAPYRVFLQVEGEYPFEDVTWSQVRQSESDIAYRRI